MSVSAKLVYDEHRVAPAAGTLATRSIRFYDEAAAVIKVENGGLTPKLADDHRLSSPRIPAAGSASPPRAVCSSAKSST